MAEPNIISIDGVVLPAPMTYSVEHSDLDSEDTGRSEDGTLHRHRVRQAVVKIQLGWEQLTTEKVSLILTAITPESFSVTYYFGIQETATMYAGNRSLKLRRVNGGQGKWDLSFDLIEF